MIGLHSFWRTDALWDCVKIGACSIFWRMRKIACVFTHAIWTVLLNNVCCIYFFRRMRKSHAIIRSEKIATHPIWMYPKAASDSALKQLTTGGVSKTCTLLYFTVGDCPVVREPRILTLNWITSRRGLRILLQTWNFAKSGLFGKRWKSVT